SLRFRRIALEQRLLTLGIAPAQVQQGKMTNRIALTSPVNGFVTAVNVNTGKYVSSSDMLFEILDTSEPFAELLVFEQDIAKIQVGQQVRLQLANQTAKEYIAHVQAINRKINEDRTVSVRAKLEGNNLDLFPKTFLKAFIELSPNPVLVLPEAAVVNSEGKDYIFIFKGREEHDHAHEEDTANAHDHEKEDPDDKHGEESVNYVFEMVEIKRGITEGGFTEIVLPENLNPKDLRVVNKGAYELLSKLKAGDEEGHAH
ncbi:MAG: efflux RND transporter periplasmic adaptor subunit, partial [Verrucomicrobia bacterium]|nr:efflux RND transporter periplasmic adaptor subunit [Cytophagales bacterium]